MNIKKLISKPSKKILNYLNRLLVFIYDNGLSIKKKKKIHNSYNLYLDEEIKKSYQYFKKYFGNSIFLDKVEIKKYAIDKALKFHGSDENSFCLEFGVYIGRSINIISSRMGNKKLYGFDSFVGLKEDWKGSSLKAGHFNLNENLPKVNSNCILIKGWINETLPNFISENNVKNVSFVHVDVDTYETTKFILETLKPMMKKNSIILFDEIYDIPGWEVGEYKALKEVFNENEFSFIAFSKNGGQAVVQL